MLREKRSIMLKAIGWATFLLRVVVESQDVLNEGDIFLTGPVDRSKGMDNVREDLGVNEHILTHEGVDLVEEI